MSAQKEPFTAELDAIRVVVRRQSTRADVVLYMSEGPNVEAITTAACLLLGIERDRVNGLRWKGRDVPTTAVPHADVEFDLNVEGDPT